MKFRDVVIFNGKQFKVPQGIQRIDTRSTHGWQVRYCGTKLFSDHSSDGSGAQAALERATQDLAQRIARLPAPVLLQKQPSERKSSQLPVGISGPIVRRRANTKVLSCSFSVLLPRYGQRPRCSTVYIGTENTFTVERCEAALAKAIAMRDEAVQAYERAATKDRRAAASVLTPGAGAASAAASASATGAAKATKAALAAKPAKVAGAARTAKAPAEPTTARRRRSAKA